ncbi:unnamed protein product, partial [Ectocarpus sp. 8 AP-2014]
MSSAGKEMGMVQRRRQIGTARAIVVAAALAVLRVADGFRYAAAPLDRGAAALSRDDHCEHGLTSATTRKSRSRLMMMATDDPELPEIIEGGSGSGEKSRFMPVSFDRVEKPVAVAKGAGIATTAVASSAPAGKMPVTTAGAKTPRVAQQGQGQKMEQFIQPEEVPTTFEPHAAQLMPNGGNTPCSIKA